MTADKERDERKRKKRMWINLIFRIKVAWEQEGELGLEKAYSGLYICSILYLKLGGK